MNPSDPDRWRRIETILAKAMEAPAAERPRFLDSACAGDADLRREVEELLSADERAEGFLSTPGAECAEALLADDAHDQAVAGPDPYVGRIVGPYRILAKLGEGGMGVVYEAQQKNPERLVALKVVRGGALADEYRLRLFERETRALGLLLHPGIATIYDAGRTDEGEPYIAMELVRGERLDEHLRSRPPLDQDRRELRSRLALFLAICDAITYAHQRGVIHRDLKPSNVVVLSRDGGSAAPGDAGAFAVKVLDFGLARIVDTESMTLAGPEVRVVQGTLPYMSPEQARGEAEQIDVRSDVYSLGVVLFEILTGRLPHDVARLPLHEGVRAISEEPPPRPSVSARALRGDLETIVLKALEKEPDARYQSAAAFAEDLRRFLADLPILARAPSTIYQLRKIVARHKGPVAFAAALLIAVLLGIAGTTTGMIKARRAERVARTEARTAQEVSTFLADLFKSSDPFFGRGGAITAREMLSEGVEKLRDGLSDEPEIRARLLANLGSVYQNMGLLAEARPLLEEALSLRERLYGPDHADVAVSLKDFGHLLIRSGDLTAARPLLERSLAIRETSGGKDAPDVADALFDLGFLQCQEGDFAGARPLLERAVSIREKALGPDDRKVADALDGLGIALIWLGESEEAKRLHTRALAINEKALGPDHPALAATLNNLGVAYSVAGDQAGALPYVERTLAICERSLGPEHPNVAIALGNVGELLEKTGHPERARPLYERALAINRKALGVGHPSVAVLLSQMANLSRDSGDAAEARRLYEEAGRIFEAALGSEHPHVAQNLDGLATLLRSTGEDVEAERVDARARAIRSKTPKEAP